MMHNQFVTFEILPFISKLKVISGQNKFSMALHVVLFGVTTNTIYSEFFCLWEMYKDTNCQSELKPVFIYTGIHMVTSCSNVQIYIS